MGVERVDYYSDDEYQQALQHEQRMQEQEEQQQPDHIDMMTEEELRTELRTALVKIEEQRRGEFVCGKCLLRQNPQVTLDDLPF